MIQPVSSSSPIDGRPRLSSDLIGLLSRPLTADEKQTAAALVRLAGSQPTPADISKVGRAERLARAGQQALEELQAASVITAGEVGALKSGDLYVWQSVLQRATAQGRPGSTNMARLVTFALSIAATLLAAGIGGVLAAKLLGSVAFYPGALAAAGWVFSELVRMANSAPAIQAAH